jgi:hypothetical protein
MEPIAALIPDQDQPVDHSVACDSVVGNIRITFIGSSRPQPAVWLVQAARVACRLTERIYSPMERDRIFHFRLLPFEWAASHARTLFRAGTDRLKAAPGLIRYPGQRRLRYCRF